MFEYPKFSKISFQVVLELIIFIKSSSEVLSKIVGSDETLVEWCSHSLIVLLYAVAQEWSQNSLFLLSQGNGFPHFLHNFGFNSYCPLV